MLVLVVALVLVGEVVVRVSGFGQPASGTATDDQAAFNAADMFERLPGDPRRYRNRPGASVTVGGVTYRHDAHGLRVAADAPPADDRPRVLFLGDSTTYGWGVAADDALPRQVARRLDERVVALNAGVSGYTTRQELAQYRALRADVAADLVVLVVYPNDVTDGALRWDPGLGVLYLDETPAPEALKPLLWRSALYRAAVAAHTRGFQRSGATSPERAENLAHVVDALAVLADEVAADGARLVVALLPVMETLDPYAFAAQRDALAAAASDAGAVCVDLLADAFLPERSRQIAGWEERNGRAAPTTARRDFLHQYWVAPRDHHLNAAGNAVAARPLADAVAVALGL